jgi:hypothetical protein
VFAQAARDIHGPAGWFNRSGTFPSIEHSEYPISREPSAPSKACALPVSGT